MPMSHLYLLLIQGSSGEIVNGGLIKIFTFHHVWRDLGYVLISVKTYLDVI